MSSRKETRSDDLGLSLTGSQISTISINSRRPGSAKTPNRPSSASGVREKSSSTNALNTAGKSSNSDVGRKKHNRTGSHNPPVTSHSETGTANTKKVSNPGTPGKGTNSNDFLALFENNTQPKIKARGGGTASGGPRKAAWQESAKTSTYKSSGNNVASNNSSRSGKSTTKLPHSIFQPISARSTSTVDSECVDYNSSPDGKANGAYGFLDPPESFNSSPDSPGMKSINANQKPVSAMLSPSIANNMTLQALSPTTKTSFMDIENSYQNIKHKTPVNQVVKTNTSPAPSQTAHSLAEDYIRSVNEAAVKIQRKYRQYLSQRQSDDLRHRAGEAAMKRLFNQKKMEREELQMKEQEQQMSEERVREDRRRNREEKARQARQDAIKELQKKREDKRLENKKKAEEEVLYLQESGKIKTKPARVNVRPKQSTSQTKLKDTTPRDSDSEMTLTHRSQRSPRDNELTRGSQRSPRDNDLTRGSQRSPRDNDLTRGSQRSPRDNDLSRGSQRSPRDNDLSRDMKESNGAMNLYNDRNDHALDDPLQAFDHQEGATSSHVQTKSTLDDLMNTLQELEADEHLVEKKPEKKRNWFDDIEKASEGGDSNSHYLSVERLEKMNHHPTKETAALRSSGLLTDDKLRSIMSFLDEVDTADRLSEIDQQIVKINEELEKPALLVPSVDEIKEMEEASKAASEVTSAMMTQRLELEEKKRTIQMLQKALNQQRELTVRHAKETEKEMMKRLSLQKDEYEGTVKRHLSFIDQLIDDKKALGEKCETLLKEMKTIDKKYSSKLKETEDKHVVELTKLKEVQAAAEKLRREKWIDEKTKKIKEMTVKGLEPEIQRLIAKHKAEIKKIKSVQEAEMLQSDERAGGRYVRMVEELRDQLAKEKEAACAREREMAKQRYEKQLQQEEEAYQAQRRRLHAEVQEEKDRLSQQAARQRIELDKLQRQLEDAHSHSVDSMRLEYEKARDEQERRHSSEVKELQERLRVEKEAWEANYMKKQETWLSQKERELKANVRKDRDKEIELVISRLEEDSVVSREECERTAENRIKRIREKYENEMLELERSERHAMEKYNEMKAQLLEVEGDNERLKVMMNQKQKEKDDILKMTEKLNKERDHVADIIRQEFADRLVATEEENKRLKTEMSELKARHRLELERSKAEIEIVNKAKEEEMAEVHKRVKQAIVKKEEVVTQLKQQHQAALKRADHLEGLLEQQRKQLLKK